MDTPLLISIIAAVIFILAVIATGIWLTVKGRYHIFYFSLLALFLLNLILRILAISALFNSTSVQYEYAEGYAPPATEPGFFSKPEVFNFLALSGAGLVILFGLLSLVNPFIRKNKLSVKIVSIVMIVVYTLLGLLLYALSQIGKIGG
jgi:hypothetical protein